jgi:outer membrane autotransporter protein
MYALDDSFVGNFSGGVVRTWGEGSHGMMAEFNSTAVNTGKVVTRGDNAFGMYAAHNAKAFNDGEVETVGDGSHGMYASGGSEVHNLGSGTVTTGGEKAHGMYAELDSEAFNDGIIVTTGLGSDAVRLEEGSSLVNTGVLDSAQGNALTALTSSDATLLDGTVLAGSHTLMGDDTSKLLVSMDIPTQADPFSAQVQGFNLFTKRGAGWMNLEKGSFVYGHTAHEDGTLEIESQTQFKTGTYYQSSDAMLYVYMNPDSYTDNDEIPLWVEGDGEFNGRLTIDGTEAELPGFYTFIRAENYIDNFIKPHDFVNLSPLFLPYGPQWLAGGSWHYTSMVGYSFSHAALGLAAAIDDWSLLRYAMANHLNDVADCMKQLEVGEKKIHAQVLAGQTKRDPSSATSAGFDSTQKGISLGFDKKQNDSTLWGLYVAYTEKDIDFTGLPMVYADWESQDTWHFGGYISKRWDKWILSDTLTYRSASHSTFRKQVGGDARASFDSWAVTNDLRLGYIAKEIGEGSHWQVIPEVGLNVGYINRGGYTEDNGFTYGDFSNTVVESVVGVRFKGEYLRGDGSTFIPQLRLGWVHVLSGEDITIDQSWGGTTYWFTESLDRDYFVADLGLSLCKYGAMDISLNYGGRFGSNSTTHGGWLRVEWKY